MQAFQYHMCMYKCILIVLCVCGMLHGQINVQISVLLA